MNVDPARLARAFALVATPEGREAYRVVGGHAPHRVRRALDGTWCDCLDAQYHPGRPCKHRLAVYLHRRLAPGVLRALRDLAPRAGQCR